MPANLCALDLLEFRKIYQNHDAFKQALTSIAKPQSKVHLHGLVGSLKSIFASILAEQEQQVTICILNDREEAAYFFDDLNNLQIGENVLFFPSSYKRAIQNEHLEQENIILRTEVLNQIREGNPVNIVTYPEALVEKVITGEALASNSFTVNKGDKLSIDFLNDVLFEYGFERVDFVFEPGQYSIRGSLVDIYSFSNEDPYRLDFFGDDVDSIRSFDIESQISKKQLSKIVIIPNIQSGLDDERRDNFLSFIPENSVLYFNDLDLITELVENSYKQALQGEDIPEDLANRIISGKRFQKESYRIQIGCNRHAYWF